MIFEIINKEDIISQYGEDFYNRMESCTTFALDGLSKENLESQLEYSEYSLMPRWRVKNVNEYRECYVFSYLVTHNNKILIEYLWMDGYRGVINHVY